MKILCNGMEWDETPESLHKLDMETTLELAQGHPELREILVSNINTAKGAYMWAYMFKTNQEELIKFIDEEHWACEWALNIGNQDIMRDVIKSEYYSVFWAAQFGDIELMRNNIKKVYFKRLWDHRVGHCPFFANDEIEGMLDDLEDLQSNKSTEKKSDKTNGQPHTKQVIIYALIMFGSLVLGIIVGNNINL